VNDVSRQSSYAVRVLTGAQAGITFPLNKAVTMIGRASQNDIVLNDTSISREHARIVQSGSLWKIEKLAERNTLKINQREMQAGTINHNDTITLGELTSFVFLITPPVQAWRQPTPQVPAARPEQPLPNFPRQPTPPPSVFQPTPGPAPVAQRVLQMEDNSLFTQRESSAVPASGVPALEVSANISNFKQITPLTRPIISIGRDHSNDIVINAPTVSAFHAQIEKQGDTFVLVHPHPQAKQQRTLNGLLYQGLHIRGDQQYRKSLARGDIFRIGDENGTLVTLTFNDGSGAAQESLPEIRPFPLNIPVITIGRHRDNIVTLKHPQVSAHHARLEQTAGSYRISDLGSTNHVYVNGQRITGQLLSPGDEIRIGPYRLTFTGTELTQYDESNGVRIDAMHLKKSGNNAVVLLDDISLVIPPRKFVALVGGSGAGKSTLMDALNGLRPAHEGKVFYNGQDYYRSLAVFSTQLGYVPQDDIVHSDLTVERALYFAAKMRLPDDFTGDQIQQRVNEVLLDVDMEDRRKLLVSKLSGGQRKRVSIALELLARPSIFFLDEPTSGLDPGLDRKMMFLLRKLADKGHTIVLVTHATNNINNCDYVCFLAPGGRLAYYGPPNEAKKFFEKADFAEIYGELEPTKDNPDAPANAESKFRRSQDYQKYVAMPLMQGPAGRTTKLSQTTPHKTSKRGHSWKQFMILTRRYLELLRNDTGNLFILLLQAPIIGLILMLIIKFVTIAGVFDGTNMSSPVTSGDAQKVLFVMSFAAVMFGCINGAREIVKELPIYGRERAVNLGIIPYMFSKIVVLGILCLLQSAILVILVSLIAPFHQGVFLPVTLEVYITLALTSLAGLMVGLLVSALAPNNDRAVSLIPLILIPQVIFAGTIFPLKSGLLQPVGLLFAVRWAMAALGTSVGLRSNYTGSDKLIGNIDSYQYGHGVDSTHYLLLMWLGLTVMIVVLGILIGYCLKRKDVKV